LSTTHDIPRTPVRESKPDATTTRTKHRSTHQGHDCVPQDVVLSAIFHDHECHPEKQDKNQEKQVRQTKPKTKRESLPTPTQITVLTMWVEDDDEQQSLPRKTIHEQLEAQLRAVMLKDLEWSSTTEQQAMIRFSSRRTGEFTLELCGLGDSNVSEVEVSTRDDNGAVILSCVVHSMTAHKRSPMSISSSPSSVIVPLVEAPCPDADDEAPPPPPPPPPQDEVYSPRTYSMMTKMMKINATLREQQKGGRLSKCGGRFVFFQTLPLCVLDRGHSLLFQKILRDFLKRARHATQELQKTSIAVSGSSRLPVAQRKRIRSGRQTSNLT